MFLSTRLNKLFSFSRPGNIVRQSVALSVATHQIGQKRREREEELSCGINCGDWYHVHARVPIGTVGTRASFEWTKCENIIKL